MTASFAMPLFLYIYISKWIKSNGLALNPQKTEFMVIGSPQRLRHFSLGNLMLNETPIKKVDTFKYLGIVLDSNISWTGHTEYLCKKASSRIGILKRTMPFLTLQSAQTVYRTIIEPLFDYCGVVWDTCGDISASKLQRLQNRAGRIILSTDIHTPSVTVRTKLKWATLQQRRKYHKATLMYKCLNNQLEGIEANYMRHADIHSYNTRQKDNLILPKPRTNYLKRTFKYTSITLWNSIPRSIQNSESTETFKRHLREINKTK